MRTNSEPINADPTDLAGLQKALNAAEPQGRLAPIGMSRIEIGPETIDLLPEVVGDLTHSERVVLVSDSTPKWRNGDDLNDLVAGLLGERFAVERAALGEHNPELHVDDEAMAEAEAAVDGAGCVVVVGSGTVTDICKVATERAGKIPLVVVQSAASVNGFSDDLSVVLKAGVKRTIPSRWPDALLVDLPTLAAAPPEMNAAGFGDAIAMYTGPADWYLASAVGMDDSYRAAPVKMLLEGGRDLLDGASALRRRDPEALDRLARMLTLDGIAIGVTGTTAALSGTEHLVSHLLDKNAGKRGLPLAFHGAQVGVATVVVAAAWEALLADLDPAAVDVDACFPEPASMEAVVREAFADLDPSGAVGGECWSDDRKKLEKWRANRIRFEEFLADWTRYRAELREMVASPERLCGALAEAGAPARFGELEPAATPETVRWALRNCHLMRNRFTLADLLFFLGWWDDAFVEKLLERARSVGGGL
ncbi:MAG TPA: iron-containing alcohol dehydrogenase [Rubrobacteraceae bacterium]|nr:iron-containing alcohol dehydrogenase [Rubrobacteraceae bacterium]